MKNQKHLGGVGQIDLYTIECKKTSLKIMNFGRSNKIDMLQQPLKGENMGHIFTNF